MGNRMQVEINITATVTTAQYGTLVAGDILRTSKEFAAHLVDDCGAAKYEAAKTEQVAAPVDHKHAKKAK